MRSLAAVYIENARKGTKRYKKQKKAEKLQAKRRAVTNVLRLIEQVSSQAG